LVDTGATLSIVPCNQNSSRRRLDRSTARYIYKAKNGKLLVWLTPSQKAKLIFIQ
jgi:hypothetical protein